MLPRRRFGLAFGLAGGRVSVVVGLLWVPRSFQSRKKGPRRDQGHAANHLRATRSRSTRRTADLRADRAKRSKGGGGGLRFPDIPHAKRALYQAELRPHCLLGYAPVFCYLYACTLARIADGPPSPAPPCRLTRPPPSGCTPETPAVLREVTACAPWCRLRRSLSCSARAGASAATAPA